MKNFSILTMKKKMFEFQSEKSFPNVHDFDEFCQNSTSDHHNNV